MREIEWNPGIVTQLGVSPRSGGAISGQYCFLVIEMSEVTSRKALVKRPARIRTDGTDRSARAAPDDSTELELVSTQMLKQILTSRNDAERKAVASVANTSTDGVLARHPASGRYEVIDDEELQQILDNNQGLIEVSRPADPTLEPLRDYVETDKLSLVSAQALRKVLQHDDDTVVEVGRGFNPYDHG